MKIRIEFLGLLIDEIRIEMQPRIFGKIYLFLDKLKSKEHIQRVLRCFNYVKGFIENLTKKKIFTMIVKEKLLGRSPY